MLSIRSWIPKEEVMKKSALCSAQNTGIPELLFNGSLGTHVPLMHELGYSGIELSVKCPLAMDVAWLMDLLQQNTLVVCNTGTGAVVDEGVFLTSPTSEERNLCRDHLKQYVQFAANIGGSLSIGCVRGMAGDTPGSARDKHRWLVTGFRDLAKYSQEEYGVNLIIEPMSKEYTSSIHTVAETLELLDEIDVTGTGLLLDTYNQYTEEEDVVGSILSAAGNISHVHISDSERRPPGMGEADLPAYISALMQTGYDGFLSLEVVPLPDPITCARNFSEYLDQWAKTKQQSIRK
jgi:5-keto-L-gluconate epimerase